jgi:hypothetical protein
VTDLDVMSDKKDKNNPVAERAEKRRQQWEAARLEEVRRLVEAGGYTEEEGKERVLLKPHAKTSEIATPSHGRGSVQPTTKPKGANL